MKIPLGCGILVSLIITAEAIEWLRTENGKKYYLNRNHVYNWYEALHKCAELDMSLLAIDTSEKNSELYNEFNKTFQPSSLTDLRIWLAGHDNAQDKEHVWITSGKKMNFTNWDSKEPNYIDKKEHCVELMPGNFKWNDVSCSLKRGYICEESPLAMQKQEALKQQNVQELQKIQKSHENEIKKLEQQKKTALDDVKSGCEKQRHDMEKQLAILNNSKAGYLTHISTLNATLEEKQSELQALKVLQHQKTEELKKLCENQILERLASANESCSQQLQIMANATASTLDSLTKSHTNELKSLLMEKNQKLMEMQEFYENEKSKLEELSNEKSLKLYHEMESLRKSHENVKKHLLEEMNHNMTTLQEAYDTKLKTEIKLKAGKGEENQTNPKQFQKMYNFFFQPNCKKN